MRTFGKCFSGKTAMLVVAALFTTACGSDIYDLGYTGLIPEGVEFRIRNWYVGAAPVRDRFGTDTYLRVERDTGYSVLVAPDIGELMFGPRITDANMDGYDVWEVVPAAIGNNVRIRNIGTGMYMTMQGANPAGDWPPGWNRPLVRPLVPGNSNFYWQIRQGGEFDAFFICYEIE